MTNNEGSSTTRLSGEQMIWIDAQYERHMGSTIYNDDPAKRLLVGLGNARLHYDHSRIRSGSETHRVRVRRHCEDSITRRAREQRSDPLRATKTRQRALHTRNSRSEPTASLWLFSLLSTSTGRKVREDSARLSSCSL